VVINPLSQITAPISEELRNKMHLKMKEARIKAHNTKLKYFKDLFTKMDKIEESVWLQVSSVQEFMSALGFSTHILSKRGKYVFSDEILEGHCEIISMQDAVRLHNGCVHWVKFGYHQIQLTKKQIKILKGDYEFAQEMKLVEQVDLKWSNKQNCYFSQKKLVKFMEIND
jgi:hypothetical protein